MTHALTTLALAAMLGLAGACGSRQEPDDVAEQALERWGIQGVEVDYDDDTKVVRLTGTVASEDLRRNAEESVRAAVGRTTTVSNEIRVEDTRPGAVGSGTGPMGQTPMADTIEPAPVAPRAPQEQRPPQR
jgi:osmotically-inducible protein OsmY